MKKLLSSLLIASFMITIMPINSVFAVSEYIDPQYSFEDRLESWKNNVYNQKNYLYPVPSIRQEVKTINNEIKVLIDDAVSCTRGIKTDNDLKNCVEKFERKLILKAANYYRLTDRFVRLDSLAYEKANIESYRAQLKDLLNYSMLDISKAEQLLQNFSDEIPRVIRIAEDTENNDEFAVLDAFSHFEQLRTDFNTEFYALQNRQQIKGFEDSCGESLKARIAEVITALGTNLTPEDKIALDELPAKCLSLVNEMKNLSAQEMQNFYTYTDRFYREIDGVINNLYNKNSGGSGCSPYGGCVSPVFPPPFPAPTPFSLKDTTLPLEINADVLKADMKNLNEFLRNTTDKEEKKAIRKQIRELKKQIKALKNG